MTTALIYVRQSRHKDYERTVSPEVQEQACRALAAVAKCEAVEVFTDLDVSGGKRARKAYDAMLARIKAGGVSVVAAYDQSRAFRSTLLAAEFKALLDEPENRAIEVVFVHGAFDRSPVGGFSYAVLAAAHEMERRMTGEKIKAAYAHMNAQGKPTGMVPFGYRRAGATLAIDEDEAAIVRRIFADYAAGDVSARQLARKLALEGIARPRSRSKHGWLPDTVVDTLRNVAYVGKTYTGHRQRRQGELVAASWPPIIDAATFERVARLLDSRRVSKRASVKADYVFQGLLICATCGQPRRVRTVYGRAYYHCREDVAAPCKAQPVREDVLLAWADALMSAVAMLGAGEWDAAVKEADERHKAQPRGRSVAGIDRSLDRLQKVFIWGELTEDAYKAERDRLTALKAEIVAEVRVQGFPPRFEDVHKEWLSADVSRRRRVLGRLFEALYVDGGAIVRYAPCREYAEEVEGVMRRINERRAMYLVPQSGRTGRPRKVLTGSGEGGILIRTPLNLLESSQA